MLDDKIFGDLDKMCNGESTYTGGNHNKNTGNTGSVYVKNNGKGVTVGDYIFV